MLTLTCPVKCLSQATSLEVVHDNKPEMQVFTSVGDLPASLWEDLDSEDRPFLGKAYLSALEQAFPDEMEFRYVLFHRGSRILGMAYFQLFGFDTKKLAFYTTGSHANWWRRLRHGLGKMVERAAVKENHRILVCGNAFLSGEYGWQSHPQVQVMRWTLEAIKTLESTDPRIFATLIKDISGVNPMLLEQGFHHFQAEPEMRLELRQEWTDFETYLEAMSSKYRQRARSAYKKSQKLEVQPMSLEEVRNREHEILALFEEVVREDKFCLKEAGPGYFSSLQQAMGDDCTLTGYFLKGELVAFRSTLREGKTLQAHFIGYRQSLNTSLKLYQRILYDLVQEALAGGYEELALGRTAMEIKSCLGAQPREYDLFLRLSHPLYNRLVRPLLGNLPVEPWQPRHPFREI